ncbi:uncharacterized protein (TIGR00369 family) [Natronocella acetinitrilica]|uniref:Uncharacterized protein (TIGR00369 family) n=1 Tax=Natronocella acetinitrilica TaxID=414046 RepID=A0AAE3KC99_9GAMM|nr:PaaI family thioesterase [Natronocella acetinitrilica]MCP1675516.1 uncharacterized protein (TIGR00369 family) [Natronocella acetinitrilica]
MMDVLEIVADARRRGDHAAVMGLFPYGEFLGIDFREQDEELIFRLRYSHDNIGNPRLPALHGGVIGAFAEHAAIVHMLWTFETAVVPRIIDFSIDYLRPGRPEHVYAACTVLRQGQRVVNAAVECWQGAESRTVVATARGHFLLSRQSTVADGQSSRS